MAEPIGAIGAPSATQYALAVARKEQDQQDLQGQQAVHPVRAAAAPTLASSGSVGTKLNFVA